MHKYEIYSHYLWVYVKGTCIRGHWLTGYRYSYSYRYLDLVIAARMVMPGSYAMVFKV